MVSAMGPALGAGGPDGVAVFDALHRQRNASDAILFAFDLIELDGEDFRPLPLAKRKALPACWPALGGDRTSRAYRRRRRRRVPTPLLASARCVADGQQ
jgi:hypothetical protein